MRPKISKSEMTFLVASALQVQAACGSPDLTIEFSIRNQVMARAAPATGMQGGPYGWYKRTLYISGKRTSEYTEGRLQGSYGTQVKIQKVHIETAAWVASFDPVGGSGSRTYGAPGYVAVLGGMFASSDAAELLLRGEVLNRLGPQRTTKRIAGHRCDLYKPPPDAVKVELCIGDIAGRRIVLYSRWYEQGTVWTEQAVRVTVGANVPAARFRVPATVATIKARP